MTHEVNIPIQQAKILDPNDKHEPIYIIGSDKCNGLKPVEEIDAKIHIYIIIINDRHTDIRSIACTSRTDAIERAKKLAKAYATRQEDYDEYEVKGFLYYANYSCEGDYVCVLETELQ